MPLPLLGLGLGALGGALSYFGSGPSRSSVGLDPRSQAYVDEMRRRNMAATSGGPPPEWLAAQQGYGKFGELGLLGANAMAGDPASVGRFMNPYESTMNPYWDQMRARAGMASNDRATGQSAFGGSRAALEYGAQQGQVDIGQAGQRYGEFGQAMGRAGQLAGMGMGALGLGANMDWGQRNAGIMAGGLGPTGSVSTGPRGNLMGSMVGGAMFGAGAFPNSSGVPGAPSTPFDMDALCRQYPQVCGG